MRGYWPKVGQEITQLAKTDKEKGTQLYKRFMWGKVGNVSASALLCFDFVEKLP